MDKDIVSDIKTTIRSARKDRGLSQAELAGRLRMTQAQIARIENSLTDPRLSTLTELSRALGLELVLVPKQLLPSVKSLIVQHRGFLEPRESKRRLVGAEPEDANDERDE